MHFISCWKTKVLCFFTLCAVHLHDTFGQEIKNSQIIQENDLLIFTFDLLPRQSGQEEYTISIEAQYGELKKQLAITGGKFENVNPTNQLKLVVDGKKELDQVKGDVDFNIKANMTYSPLIFVVPEERREIKKGSQLEVKWEGGIENDTYAVQLVRGKKAIRTLTDEASGHSLNWKVSPFINAGKNYKLELKSLTHDRQTTLSKEFVLKRKIPLVLKIAPIAVLGAVATYFILDSDSGQEVEPAFPDPPALP